MCHPTHLQSNPEIEYPQHLIDAMDLTKYSDFFNDHKERFDISTRMQGDVIEICPSILVTHYPRFGTAVIATDIVIINHGNYSQAVDSEECAR